jgi:hypothetical protein
MDFPDKLNSTRRLSEILKSPWTHLCSGLFLFILVAQFTLQIVGAIDQANIKTTQRQTLTQELANLKECTSDKFDDNICLRRLSVVSKLLDKSPTETNREAVAWGAIQSLLDSRHLEDHPELHDRVVKWASVEKYVNNGERFLPSAPDTIRAFREELKRTYFAQIQEEK